MKKLFPSNNSFRKLNPLSDVSVANMLCSLILDDFFSKSNRLIMFRLISDQSSSIKIFFYISNPSFPKIIFNEFSLLSYARQILRIYNAKNPYTYFNRFSWIISKSYVWNAAISSRKFLNELYMYTHTCMHMS